MSYFDLINGQKFKYTPASRSGNNPYAVTSFYLQQKLSSHQNGTETLADRECLVVVDRIKRFNLYLFGTSFTMITDQKPLIGVINHYSEIGKMASVPYTI